MEEPMEPRISLTQDKAFYHSQRVKTAVVVINGAKFNLNVSDTSRCAMSQEAAARTLRNLAKQAGVDDFDPDGKDAQLHTLCRELMGLKKPAAPAEE
jgi:hypothetical protein